MRHIILTMLALCLCISGSAQQKKRESFRKEMHDFITKEVGLSAKEAAAFFPVYHEMRKKQRVLFEKSKTIRKQMPQNDKQCLEAVRQLDNIDIEMKKIQQDYHERFMKVLPPAKVFKLLKAEEQFHRNMLHKIRKPKDN